MRILLSLGLIAGIVVMWLTMRANQREWIAVPACAADHALSADGDAACRLDDLPMTLEEAQTALAGKPIVITRQGDDAIILVRSAAGAVPLCCTTRGEMEQISGTNIWWAGYRFAEIDRAMLTYFAPRTGEAEGSHRAVWRGRMAPLAPAWRRLRGTVRNETLASTHLGETRVLRIYTPPGFPRDAPYKAIFMTDGEQAGDWAMFLEPLIASGRIPPLVIVGSISGQDGVTEDRSDVARDLRAADYLPGHTGARFEQFMAFFSEELTAWAERTLGVSTNPLDRIVWGASNGATFALWAGARRPQKFGAVFAASPAAPPLTPETLPPSNGVAFYLSAGLYERPFLVSAKLNMAALKAQNYPVSLDIYAAGHATDMREVAYVKSALAFFGVSAPPALRRQASD